MATNFATDFAHNELAARRTRLSFEHRFFLAVAILFPLINIIGFAPSYYFKPAFSAPPLPSLLVHAHGAVMTLWIVLFSVQAGLISAKRIRMHMTLGMMSIALAVAMVVIGTMTSIAAARRGVQFPGYTALEFMIIPLGDMITFPLLFGAAIYYRKRPAEHKRLMLVTVLNFLAPSLSRFPLPFIPDLGAIWFVGVPSAIAILLLAGDTYRTGRMNRVFAAGVALMVSAGVFRVLFARTETWQQVAAWLVG